MRGFVKPGCAEGAIGLVELAVRSVDIVDPRRVIVGIQVDIGRNGSAQPVGVEREGHRLQLVDTALVGDVGNRGGVVEIAYHVSILPIGRRVFAVRRDEVVDGLFGSGRKRGVGKIRRRRRGLRGVGRRRGLRAAGCRRRTSDERGCEDNNACSRDESMEILAHDAFLSGVDVMPRHLSTRTAPCFVLWPVRAGAA